MKRNSKILNMSLSVAILSSMFTMFLGEGANRTLAAEGATLIATTALGAPVSGGGKLFWVDNRYDGPVLPPPVPGDEGRFRAGSSIYGYNLATQSAFLVTSGVEDKRSLATDGTTLAWVEEYAPTSSKPPTSVIKTYAISTGVIATLITAPNADLSGLALDQGVLYYIDSTPGHSGLYARYLSGPLAGNEQLITTSANDSRITVNQGKILWSNEQSPYSEGTLRSDGSDEGTMLFKTYRVVTTTLHLSTLDKTIPDRVVASAQGCLTGYSVSSDRIVYSFSCGAEDERVYEYEISTLTTKVLSTAAATYPLVSGDTVVWTNEPTGAIGEIKAWSVQKYDTVSAKTEVNVGASSADTRAEVIVDSNTLALRVAEDATREAVSLYLNSLATPSGGQGPTTFQDQTPAPQILTTCDRARPSTCGQVRKHGSFFLDDGGYWPMNGVQFILPQAGSGLSGETFFSSIYDAARNDGSLEYWLGIAQNYLLAKTLRVIVQAENSNTCFSCLQDFADRANNHGMRLGVVLRNSTAQLGNTNRAFLNSFYGYFTTASGQANKIAYISIDNEINNHVGTGYCPTWYTDRNGNRVEIRDAQGRVIDCYDRWNRPAPPDGGGDPTKTYINKASTWARDFNRKYLAYHSTILRTVGISTEMGDWDGFDSMYDFFRWPSDSTLTRLVDNVDFLSPHRYNGNVLPLRDSARNSLAYWGPLMLEEYGWPTDPYNDGHNSSWRDPQQNQTTCRSDPLGNAFVCSNTAPYIIELAVRRVRASGSSGFAGTSAWMMADIDGSNCSSASDVFTGLFTANATYCGGTYSPHGAYDKNGAYRVRNHHFYFDPHP